jgi:hypothetical protein
MTGMEAAQIIGAGLILVALIVVTVDYWLGEGPTRIRRGSDAEQDDQP